MGSRPTKPSFLAVVDLGLRDVGVEPDPRGQTAQLGKAGVQVVALMVASVFAMCIVTVLVGAGPWAVILLALMWPAVLIWLALRMAKRSPVRVVKVTAAGVSPLTWHLLAPLFLTAASIGLSGDPRLIAVGLLAAIPAALLWRASGYVPEVLRRFEPLLADGEAVVGDGVGRVGGAWSWREGFRLVVATDRRLIVAGSPHSAEPFLLVDAPYPLVTGFGVEWTQAGRAGILSLTVAGAGGEPPETYAIGSIAPANLVSIASALRSHGVPADDPAAVAEAERAWEQARERGGAPSDRPRAHGPAPTAPRTTSSAPRISVPAPPAPRQRLFDRAAMNTPAFDRGLWLLLAVAAVALYVNPFGVGLGTSRDATVPVLLVVPVVCGICGYVAGTRSSLAYVVPLNLFAVPALFFMDASVVISLMIMLSLTAAIGLWLGSRLREARGGSPAGTADGPAPRPTRGSLRYTLSGLGLIRLTGMILAGAMVLSVTAGAAGLPLSSLRLAIFEATAKQVPVDGRSNLTGGAASVRYTVGPDLREFITDDLRGDAQTSGARWELRSSFRKGFNAVSLAHYVYEPRLDDPAAVAAFVAKKDREHSRLAGFDVTHTERMVAGRRGYVWNHPSRNGFWYFAAWFPQPVHTVRLECIADKQEDRFRRLCSEALRSLEFRR
ncbi:MAG TPA: hypothetical protein VF712_06585 [Thermoleophilaceae bacterium]